MFTISKIYHVEKLLSWPCELKLSKFNTVGLYASYKKKA